LKHLYIYILAVCYSANKKTASAFSKVHFQQRVADKQAADNKTAKCHELDKTYIFSPVAIQTAGSRSQQVIELVQEIGRHIFAINEDSSNGGNAVSFLRTFPQD